MFKKIWAMLARSSEEPTESLERELNQLSPEQRKTIADKYSPELEMPSTDQKDEEEVTIDVPEPEEPKPVEPGSPEEESVANDDDLLAAA